jgi:hypothetical protein
MPTLPAPLYPVTPAPVLPPLHGLLAAALRPPDEPGSRWELGFAFEPEGWAEATAIPGAWCGDELYQDKPVQAPPDVVDYHPFQIVISYSCKFGRTGPERRDKAARGLAAAQSKAIERELWVGELADPSNMALAVHGTGGGGALTTTDRGVVLNPGYDPTAAVTTASPVDLGTGFAILSQALADHGPGGKGMFHLSTFAGELACQRGLAVEDGRGGVATLRTKSRGDLVVVGAGYPGTGPGGDVPPAGRSWIHATTMVSVRLGEIRVFPETDAAAIDRYSGAWTVYAEQTVAAYWDGQFQASVLVDYGMTPGGVWGSDG